MDSNVTRTSVSFRLAPGTSMTPGLVTSHDVDRPVGHVTFYLGEHPVFRGSVTIKSEDPGVLRRLAASLVSAADDLESTLTENVEVPA